MIAPSASEAPLAVSVTSSPCVTTPGAAVTPPIVGDWFEAFTMPVVSTRALQAPTSSRARAKYRFEPAGNPVVAPVQVHPSPPSVSVPRSWSVSRSSVPSALLSRQN